MGTDQVVNFIKKYNQYNENLGQLLIAKDLHHSDRIKIFLEYRDESKAMLKWIKERE